LAGFPNDPESLARLVEETLQKQEARLGGGAG
jgi:hypothetical protein